MEEKIINRVFMYLKDKGIPHTRFEKDLGLSNGYLKQQEKRNADLGESVIRKIIDNCLDIDALWLLTGKGSMTNNNMFENVNIIHHPKLPDKIINSQTIKLYELEAAANLNSLSLEASKEFAENIQIPNAPKCDGATYVKGDSMYPLLKSGDIIAFKKVHNIDYISYGEMYLVSYTIDGDDYLVVKFVCKSEKEGHIKLVSQNEYHASKDIPVSSIRYLGIIKLSIRLNSSI